MRFILTTLLLLLLAGSSQAISRKEAIEAGINYSACKVAFNYCASFTQKKPGSPEDNAFQKVLKGKLNGDNVGSTPTAGETIGLLDGNEFKGLAKGMETIVGGINRDTTQSAIQTAGCITDAFYANPDISKILEAYPALNHELKASLERYYKEQGWDSRLSEGDKGGIGTAIPEAVSPVPETKSDEAADTLRTQVDQLSWTLQEHSKDHLCLLIACIFLLLLIAAAFFFNKRKMRELKTELSRIKSLKERPQSETTGTPATVKQALKKTTGEDHISDLNKAIADLQKRLTDLELQSVSSRGKQESAVHPGSTGKPQLLYAPLPNTNGSFTSSAVTEDMTGNSYYVFTMMDERLQTASFTFLDNAQTIGTALDNPERVLLPACTLPDRLNQDAKRIRTITPGRVRLSGDKWMIERKAEIVYE